MTGKHKSPKEHNKWEDFQEKVEGEEGELIEEEKALEHPDYAQLQTKLTEAENKYLDAHDKTLRLQAEYENLRRRNERDLAQAHKYALEKIAGELLGVADNLERGLAQAVGDDLTAFRTGMELTLKQLQGVFDKFGIKAVDPKVGDSFDPAVQEAMATKESDLPASSVVEVLQKGYQLNDRLLRPALVVVAKA